MCSDGIDGVEVWATSEPPKIVEFLKEKKDRSLRFSVTISIIKTKLLFLDKFRTSSQTPNSGQSVSGNGSLVWICSIVNLYSQNIILHSGNETI